jgi:HK97 gp10 family phage protein
MSADIDVRGVEEAMRLLSKVEGAPLKKTLQKATNASAKFLKPKVQAAAPRKTGKLRKSISAGQAKRDRPSSIVKARPKVAFYRHMVMGGTKAHRIRFPDQKRAGVSKSAGNIQHPGSKAQPFIERTSEQYRVPAVNEALKVIKQELDT